MVVPPSESVHKSSVIIPIIFLEKEMLFLMPNIYITILMLRTVQHKKSHPNRNKNRGNVFVIFVCRM